MPKTKVSFSESDSWRQCHLKWQLGYGERWRSDEEAPALRRGTALHACMEYHYGVIKKHGDAKKDVDAAVLAKIRETMVEKEMLDQEGADPLVEFMYDGYVDFYGADNAWEILATEIDFEVPLYNRDGSESEFVLHGRIDLIVRNRGTGKIFVVDHKTCANLPTEKALDFDEQMAMYTIAGRRMGYKIHGAVYNAIRSKKLVRPMTSEERFSRKVVTKTEFELQVVEHELVDTMRDAYRPREFDPPRSPDSDRCNWKCNFKEACLAGRKSGPERMRQFLADTGFSRPEGGGKASVRTTGPVQLDLVAEIAKVESANAVEAVNRVAIEEDGDWCRSPGSPWQLKASMPLSGISRIAAGV